MSDYNGYPNRATWNVSLWLNNDEPIYREMQTVVKRANNVEELANMLRAYCSLLWPSFKTPDGCPLSECDFGFIARDEWDDAHYVSEPTPSELEHTLYECGICDCLHPWKFAGDCRDDANRFGDAGEYAEKKHVNVFGVTVKSWAERQEADNA